MTDFKDFYTLRFMCLGAHGSFDLQFRTEEAADAEYNRTIRVRDTWLEKYGHDDHVPIIPFDTRGDCGIAYSVNLVNYVTVRLTNELAALANARSEVSMRDAQDKHGIALAGFVGGPK